MVAEITGVVYDTVPTAIAVPKVAVLYQSIVVPAIAAADKATVPGPHLAADVPIDTAGFALTVAATIVLVSETHPVVVFLDWA